MKSKPEEPVSFNIELFFRVTESKGKRMGRLTTRQIKELFENYGIRAVKEKPAALIIVPVPTKPPRKADLVVGTIE